MRNRKLWINFKVVSFPRWNLRLTEKRGWNPHGTKCKRATLCSCQIVLRTLFTISKKIRSNTRCWRFDFRGRWKTRSPWGEEIKGFVHFYHFLLLSSALMSSRSGFTISYFSLHVIVFCFSELAFHFLLLLYRGLHEKEKPVRNLTVLLAYFAIALSSWYYHLWIYEFHRCVNRAQQMGSYSYCFCFSEQFKNSS